MSATATTTATNAPAAAERTRLADDFASGIQASQLIGAAAVLAGGLLAAVLLRRAERSEAA
ncbi:hypothetical protein QMK19_01835 [Streptomyces sp. H10-C2]|uniref:hypothetical protein n=1 Tax=unclassified Streptomyces TaxID=2593676 RepID=UPI0024BBEA5D|nr:MULTISPECIES: hypothetical protein [unclassified Streptomyces]MDJ0342112.1 hypothetical protein [Streptomyces sp. PH10-H1]MDJ0368454.1 hypothetical protein [Streptomyces sp. H10-C2]